MSQHISNQAIKGLSKIGDIFLPGNEEFPKYSEVAGTYFVNDMVQYAPEEDLASLNLVLIIFSFLPKFVLRWLVNKMGEATAKGNEGMIPTTLRQLDLGLRGILYATYYGEFTNPEYKGKTPVQLMDYQVNRVEK
jgi:hypothetical protein